VSISTLNYMYRHLTRNEAAEFFEALIQEIGHLEDRVRALELIRRQELRARGVERFAPLGNEVIDVYAPDHADPLYAKARDYADAISLAKELNEKDDRKGSKQA